MGAATISHVLVGRGGHSLSHGHLAATVRRYRPCRPAAITPTSIRVLQGEGTRGIPQHTDCRRPSLALQLAQIGIGRVRKTGSFLALPLHSNYPSTVTLAPCRLPICDGAGMHSSADWCLPKPEHPLQAVARPWLHWQCHVSSGTRQQRFLGLPTLALRKPGSGNSSVYRVSPEAGQPYRVHLLHALAKSWGDPDMALLPFLQHGSGNL